MTDVPLPAPGDTSWSDWGQDVEDTTDQIHAATAAATPSTVVKRDAAGRFAAVDGAAAGDVVTKGQLDTKADAARLISTTAPLTGGGDLSADRTLAVSAATATAVGVVELATTAEASAGTDTARAVTPAGLAARTPAASETVAGLVELATAAETTTGTDTTRAVHPAGVKAVADTKLGIVSGSGLVDADKITQAAYDALTAPRPAGRIYFIVG